MKSNIHGLAGSMLIDEIWTDHESRWAKLVDPVQWAPECLRLRINVHEEDLIAIDMDEMPIHKAKFNKSRRIWMSNRYIDPVERMRRQRLHQLTWGPTPAKKMAATQ
jgi:hypothetical protein